HTEQPLVTAFGVGQHVAGGGAVDIPAFQQKADKASLRHVQFLGGGAQVGAVPQVDEQVVVDGFALQPGVVRLQRRVLLALRQQVGAELQDRKSTRLNSSHVSNSYAVFCLKKKKTKN